MSHFIFKFFIFSTSFTLKHLRYSMSCMSKLIVANWKSNKTPSLAKEWLREFSATSLTDSATVVVAPAFSLVPVVYDNLYSPLKLAAQDVSPFPMGSYTGAVNAQQLKSTGVEYVILGHSERRRYFHETHADVAAKLQQAINNNLQPILCLDEEYIDQQADALESTDIPNLVIAYEPLAAIGTGKNAPADKVAAVIGKIRQVFGQVPVIYGGSVDERSVAEYLLISDGVLVGSASLDPVQFKKIVVATQTPAQ